MNLKRFPRINYYLIKANRISAWVLLVFMIVYIVTGYAWTDHIVMSTSLARHLHTDLTVYMVFFFLAHALISAKFALKRWKVQPERLVNVSLVLIGITAFALVLSVNV